MAMTRRRNGDNVGNNQATRGQRQGNNDGNGKAMAWQRRGNGCHGVAKAWQQRH